MPYLNTKIVRERKQCFKARKINETQIDMVDDL